MELLECVSLSARLCNEPERVRSSSVNYNENENRTRWNLSIDVNEVANASCDSMQVNRMYVIVGTMLTWTNNIVNLINMICRAVIVDRWVRSWYCRCFPSRYLNRRTIDFIWWHHHADTCSRLDDRSTIVVSMPRKDEIDTCQAMSTVLIDRTLLHATCIPLCSWYAAFYWTYTTTTFLIDNIFVACLIICFDTMRHIWFVSKYKIEQWM
jgi:hypothetical protein